MMTKRNRGPGIVCTNCGCRLDPGERCDCEEREQRSAQQRKTAKTRRIIAHNIRMMEQARIEFDYA